MKIKTYVVNNIKEAYPMIFNDLGTDAFILNTKTIKTGGFLGLFQKKKVKVLAAADHSTKKIQPEPKPKEFEGSNLETQSKELNRPNLETQSKELNRPNLETQSKELNRPNLETQSKEYESPHHKSQQEVLKELSEVKDLISSLFKSESTSPSIPKPLEKWVMRLRDQEVDEEVIQYILKKVKMRHENINDLTEQEVKQAFLTIVEQLLEEGITKDTGSSPFFITLVGPTGVGKTTTIAKLAAARVFQQRQKVGLLTTDTFRIAAVEQLKTYANILNIPLEVVENAEDLKNAMVVLKGCHIVFMDSAGRNYLEDEYIEEINRYLRCDVPQENHLVLSMTTRWRDMRKIVDQMKSVPIDKLILTKWDETSCFGVALNMVYHYPYPLSYLGLGQGVPQDIMIGDAVYMAKKILGVDENETGPGTSFKTII